MPGEAVIELLPKVSEYLSLIMTLIFAFGITFQLPVVLTPPDIISQLALAIPTLLLYEASIIAVQMVEKKRAADAASTIVGSTSSGTIRRPSTNASAQRC